MITKSETLIITAAMALAMVPRFEAKVEEFTKTHRVEIQMAVNQLQGKPAIPFAPSLEAAPTEDASQLASVDQEKIAPRAELVREQRELTEEARGLTAEMAKLRPQIKAATRMHLAELPELGNLRMVAAENFAPLPKSALHIFAKTPRCRTTLSIPVPPAAPTPVSFTVETQP